MNPTVSSASAYSPASSVSTHAGAVSIDRRSEFCARFRDERERRNRTLVAISSATKLQASLLEAFERGDISRWPKGIYRRAFFRDYVTAIGLPLDPHLLAEFIELFPDADVPTSEAVARPAAVTPPPPATAPAWAPGTKLVNASFRITLAEDASAWTMRATSPAQFRRRVILRQAAAAVGDLLLVALAALVVSRWAGAFWMPFAIVAGAYYSLCTAIFGRTLTSTLLIRPELMTEAWSKTVALGTQIGARLRQTRDRAPELIALVERAAQNRPQVGDSLSRLKSRLRLPRIASRQAQDRERELDEVRRRRLEATTEHSAEEVSV